MPGVVAATAAAASPSDRTSAMRVAGTLRIAELRANNSTADEFERRPMCAAVAGHQDAAVRVEIEIGSAPIGGEASRPLDDRNHRAEIVWFEARFKDEVDEAGGKETIGVAIGAEARELDRARHSGRGRGVSTLQLSGRPRKHRGATEP